MTSTWTEVLWCYQSNSQQACTTNHTTHTKAWQTSSCKGELKFFVFYNFSGHWVLSELREGVVFLYDSLQSKTIHPDLQKQILAFYGKRLVRVPPVQFQKGSTDHGCFAIAFCVSLLYGDDPTTLAYEQKKMREHITAFLPSEHHIVSFNLLSSTHKINNALSWNGHWDWYHIWYHNTVIVTVHSIASLSQQWSQQVCIPQAGLWFALFFTQWSPTLTDLS